MATISSGPDEMKPFYTVVVIGSGYGGGIAASRLARAGQSVCVLERGKEIRPGDYPNNEVAALEQFQIDTPLGHEGSRTAMFDFRINEGMSALVGCGLGGTSLINANVALEPAPAVFADERWPAELRVPGVLDEGYERARQMLEPTVYPDSSPPLDKLEALRLSAQSIEGASFEKTPIYVTFTDPPGGVNKVGVPQQACTLCGNCVSGCNFSAKNTILMNYLPDAKNHGAEIFTEVSVDRVEQVGEQWMVYYHQTDSTDHKLQTGEMSVTADIVVISAGTLGSTEILLRSKAAGLTVSDQVGQHFSSNGDLLGFAYNGDRTINSIGSQPVREPAPGPCITGVISTRAEDTLSGYIIEEATTPGAITVGLAEAYAIGGKLIGVNTAPDDKLAQLERAVESMVLGVHHGATQNTQTLLGMGYDSGTGVLFLDNNRLRISWPDVGQEATFTEESDGFLTATQPLNGIYIKEPIWIDLLKNSLLTVHPLGGCAMASSAELGVVDHKGRVFSSNEGTDVYKGLYVTDGSVVPMPLAVNPSFTISAISERCVSLIAADYGWTIHYAFGEGVSAAS